MKSANVSVINPFSMVERRSDDRWQMTEDRKERAEDRGQSTKDRREWVVIKSKKGKG
jgi:hypothetical protein